MTAYQRIKSFRTRKKAAQDALGAAEARAAPEQRGGPRNAPAGRARAPGKVEAGLRQAVAVSKGDAEPARVTTITVGPGMRAALDKHTGGKVHGPSPKPEPRGKKR